MSRVPDEALAALTDRDREVLVLLYRFHWMAAQQLAGPWFPSTVAARHRLRALSRLGLTRWVRVRGVASAGCYLWGLAPEGIRAARLLVGERSGAHPGPWRRQALLHWRHQLELNQLFADLTRRLGAGAFGWEADREVCLRFASILGGPGPTLIWPDARITLAGDVRVLLEYDRGTMAQRAMAEKFRRYAEYFRECGPRERLAVITLSPARRRSLAELLAAARCPGQVATRDEILQDLVDAHQDQEDTGHERRGARD